MSSGLISFFSISPAQLHKLVSSVFYSKAEIGGNIDKRGKRKQQRYPTIHQINTSMSKILSAVNFCKIR